MATRRAIAQLPMRSVHLRITPRPASLSESREILRVLQRFGDISMYKHMQHEYHNPAPNTALAIYRSPEGAQKALNASPIRFTLEKVATPDDGTAYPDDGLTDEASSAAPTSPDDGIDDILRPSPLLNRTAPQSQFDAASPTSASHDTTALPFAPNAPVPTTHKWFQVVVDRSRVVHQDFVERQPLWKQFSPMRSLAQESLSKVVPHVGLSDVSKRPPNAHRTPNKVLKSMNLYVEKGMPSVRKMWEEARGNQV